MVDVIARHQHTAMSWLFVPELRALGGVVTKEELWRSVGELMSNFMVWENFYVQHCTANFMVFYFSQYVSMFSLECLA